MKPREQLLSESHEFKVTGVMMQYYAVCKRELWFESHGIEIDRENEHIVKGTIIDEDSYQYLNRKTIHIGPIAPDLLDNEKIVEIKPSESLEESTELQLLYYMWYFKHKLGIEKDGVIAYPEQRKRKEVDLNEENEKRVEQAIQDIYKITESDTPPELEKKPVCENCAFKDFCWV